MTVVIAIDAGTTGVRAAALREDGTAAGFVYREFTQHFPRPGWVEHDALTRSGRPCRPRWPSWPGASRSPSPRSGSPTSARRSWRGTAAPASRCTGPSCGRTVAPPLAATSSRAAGHEPLVRATTGLVLDPYFSATKLEWLLAEGGVADTPDLALGTVDSWVLWNLTGGTAGGVHATEPSNASRTMLFDLRTLAWSDELIDLFGVPRHALPEVLPSSGRFGLTAAGSGLPAGIPVSGIAGDQQAALFGQACLEPGMTKNTYGTGSFVLMHVGDTCPEPVEGLLTTVGWTLADGTRAYALEGAVFVTGAAVQWLRDGLGIITAGRGRRRAGRQRARHGRRRGGPRLHRARQPVVGSLRPGHGPRASPAGHGRAHLARAVLESIALQTRDVVDAMSAASGHPIRALKADGGASANDLLLQLQADHLGVPVSRPVIQETTALGAAYLAGLAEGVWASTADITANWQLDAVFEPARDLESLAPQHEAWARGVERSRAWARDADDPAR